MVEISSEEGQQRLKRMQEESEIRLEQHDKIFKVSKYFDSDIQKIIKKIIRSEKINVTIINHAIKKQSPNIEKIIAERQNYIDRNRSDLALYVNLSYLRKQYRMNYIILFVAVLTGIFTFIQALPIIIKTIRYLLA